MEKNTGNHVTECDSSRWTLQPREVKFEPYYTKQYNKLHDVSAKSDARHIFRTTPVRLQAMNGANKNTKFADISVLSGEVVKPCTISARKHNTAYNAINGAFCNATERATSARGRQRDQRTLEPVSLETNQKVQNQRKQLQRHNKQEERGHLLSPSSTLPSHTHYKLTARSKPPTISSNDCTELDLHVEGNSVLCNSESVYACHALEELTSCVALERSLRERWEAARAAKIEAFRQITKIVLYTPKLSTSAKQRFTENDSGVNCNNKSTANSFNNVNNNSDTSHKHNITLDNNNSIVNVGKGINYACGNVSYSQGENMHGYAVSDTLSLARCSIITNTLVTTIQNYIRYSQSCHFVHVFAHMQTKLEKCKENSEMHRPVSACSSNFMTNKIKNDINDINNNINNNNDNYNFDDSKLNSIVTTSTTTQSVEDILDLEEINKLKQLYFDYFDCEVLSEDIPEWSSTGVLPIVNAALDNSSLLNSSSESLQKTTSTNWVCEEDTPSPFPMCERLLEKEHLHESRNTIARIE